MGPAGVVAIMGNHRDWTASRFLDAFETLLEAHSRGYRRDYRRTAFATELAPLPWIEATTVHTQRWARRLAPEALGGLLLSSSITQRAIEALGGARFHAALDRMIADALAPDGTLEFPYVAEIHLARKRRA